MSLNNSLEPVESVARGEHDVTAVHTLKCVCVNKAAEALLQKPAVTHIVSIRRFTAVVLEA